MPEKEFVCQTWKNFIVVQWRFPFSDEFFLFHFFVLFLWEWQYIEHWIMGTVQIHLTALTAYK
jgi:hypothetical protein